MMLEKSNLISKIKTNFFGIVYSVFVIIFFLFVFKLQIPTDIQLHIRILSEYLNNGSFPNPPLYYFSIYLLNILFENNFIYAAVIVLSLASIIKFYLVKIYLRRNEMSIKLDKQDLLVFTLMFLSPIFVFFIDKNTWYLGKFTSTIWHNSTIIFVFPFCIWLFLESLNYLKKPGVFLLLKVFIISILILLAKPSFLFAFIVAFPFICIYEFGLFNKWFFYVAFMCLIILCALFFQKNLIYDNSELDKLFYNNEKSKIIIAPFKVWLAWSKHPISNFLTSFAFILSFIIMKFRVIKNDMEVCYSLLLLLVSLIVFFTFAESGARFWHGNFYWQIPISMLIANMVLIKKTVIPHFNNYKGYLSIRKGWQKDIILLFFYSLQFVSGIFYVIQIFRTKSYY